MGHKSLLRNLLRGLDPVPVVLSQHIMNDTIGRAGCSCPQVSPVPLISASRVCGLSHVAMTS